MECLENVIGLSRTNCECFTDESQYNESESGFYIDELEGLNITTIDKSQDCATGEIWDFLSKARTNAINDFKTDMMSAIAMNYKTSMKTFDGIIGKARWDGSRSPNYTLSGLKIMPIPARKGILTIKKLYLAMNTSGTYTGYLYSSDQNDNDDPLETFTITVTAQSWGSVELNYEKPMVSEDGNRITYYLVIENQGNKVMNNTLACCGFKPNCSTYGRETQLDRIWYNYAMIGGVVANDLEGLADCTPNSNLLYGMRVDLNISCDAADVICDNLDFEGGGNAMVIAKAIQYKSGFHTLAMILSSTTINRYTMMDRESMFAKKASYQAEYQNRINYLGSRMNITLNGCWSCENKLGIKTI